MPRTYAGTRREFPEGTGKSIMLLPGRAAYVFCFRGQLRAFINRCTHMGGPLHLVPADERLVCGWHVARFDPETGEREVGEAPAGSCLTKVTVEEDETGIWLVWEKPNDPFDF